MPKRRVLLITPLCKRDLPKIVEIYEILKKYEE